MTYLIQVDGVIREMTTSEAAAHEQFLANAAAADEAAAIEAAAALEARKAPLRRLGLTEDEINTVLGL